MSNYSIHESSITKSASTGANPNLATTREQLSSLDKNSSLWDAYKHLDVNNNGTLADDNISEETLLEFGRKYGFVPDGTFDSNVKQGTAEDCWLISETKALEQTNWGKSAINEALDFKGHSGTEEDPYTLKIYNTEGEQIEIKVTNADLKEEYSKGEIDMQILEAGIDKYLQSEVEAGRRSTIDNKALTGGIGTGKYTMAYMLAGKEPQGLTSAEILEENKDTYKPLTKENAIETLSNRADNSEIAMICAFKKPSFFKRLFGLKDKGQQIPEHGYTVTNVVKDESGKILTVSYVNPWNTGKEYTVSGENFLKNIAQLTWVQ